MAGYRNRQIFYAEGFGYDTTTLRKIYNQGTAAATATMDTTTVPGRNFVSIPAGQYLDITLPRYDSYPYSETFDDANWTWVIQGKIYIDAATYTNVSANRYLFETSSSDGGFTNIGLSPNTSTAQDNWFIKFADGVFDYAINVNAGGTPAIPMRTVKDIKLVVRVTFGNDGQVWAYVDDNLVAWTGSTGISDQMDFSNDKFKGFRIHGLADQTGPTLWGDLIAYRAYYNTETLSLVNSLDSKGTLLPKTVRVYDVTPDTTVGGIDEFDTVGAVDPITALSTLDNSSYVTSSDFDQIFRLKPSLPNEYTGDNSTAVSITDDTPVHGFNYMTWRSNLDTSDPDYVVSVSEDASPPTYRYRYYRLLLSTYGSSNTDSTFNGVQFVQENGAVASFPTGTTMRLNSAGGVAAVETSGSIVNTTVHTALLNSAIQNLGIYSTINALTGVDIRNDSNIAEYIIDCGLGNVGPDWISFGITQTQNNSARLISAALFGSSDGSSWMLLSDDYETFTATGSRTTDYLVNPRHASYRAPNPRGMTKDLTRNDMYGSNFHRNHFAYPGDPLASAYRNGGGTSKTPIRFQQFKNYQFGLETLGQNIANIKYDKPAEPLPPGTTLFDYPDFSDTTDLVLRSSGAGGGQIIGDDVYLTTTAGGVGNLYRTVLDTFDYSWSMQWNMEIGGGNGADGFTLQWTVANTATGGGGGDCGRIALSSTKHQLMFRTYSHSRLTWLKDNVSQGDYVIGTNWRQNLYYWIDYDHANSKLYITYSSSNALRPPPQVTLDNFSFPGGTSYYVGFGAATGGSNDNHILKSWRMSVDPITNGLILNLDAADNESYPGSGTTWFDTGPNGLDATLVNAPTFNDTYFNFNNVNQYAYVSHNSLLHPTSAITASVWARHADWSTTGTNGDRFISKTEFGGYNIAINDTSGYVTFALEVDNTYRIPKILNSSISSGWHHLVGTFDGRYVKLYVDAVLADTIDVGSTLPITYQYGNRFIIGAEPTTSTGIDGNYLNGDIGSVSLYDRALSDAEVRQLYYATRRDHDTIIAGGLILDLDAADSESYPGTGTTWNDMSGYGHNATLVNGATYTSNLGGAISLDGVDDYVNVSETAALQPQILTIDLTFRINSATNTNYGTAPSDYQYLVFRQNTRTNRFEGYTLIYRDSDQTIIMAASTAGGTQSAFATTGTFAIGQVHHITAVFDNTTMKIYKNGVYDSQASKSSGISYRSDHTLKLGRAVPVSSTWDAALNGDIFACRIYNRALSDSEITQNFNAIRGRFGL